VVGYCENGKNVGFPIAVHSWPDELLSVSHEGLCFACLVG
jgi:hypothetical protein